MGKFYLGIILVVFFIIYFAISLPYYSGDVKNHIVWGSSILSQGPVGFYDREFHDYSFPNYPPVSMFLFALCVGIFNLTVWLSNYLNQTVPVFPSNIVHFLKWDNTIISFLKLPAIIPAMGIGLWFYLIFDHLKKSPKKIKLLHVSLLLINPAIIYLAAVWGQNDLLQNVFILFAFYFLITKKPLTSSIFGALAILSKQTILVIWALYMLTFLKLYGFKKTFMGGLITLAVIYLFYLPFNNHGLLWPFEFYMRTLSISTGFLVSDDAINFWGSFVNFGKVDAAQTLFILTYEKWGFVLFGLLSLPLVYIFWKRKFSIERLFQFLFLESLGYFFLLTRMHERYLIPGVIFAGVLAAFSKKYWLNYIFFSLLFFVNLYQGLAQPDIPILDQLLLSHAFLNSLVVLYGLFIVYNYYLFFRSRSD